MADPYKTTQAVPDDTESLRFHTQTELERVSQFSESINQELIDLGAAVEPKLENPVQFVQFQQDSTNGTWRQGGFIPPPNDIDPATSPLNYGGVRGLVWYDEGAQALTYYNDDPDVQVNMGRELLYRVGNLGGVINPGQVIRLDVAGAFDGWPLVVLAQADTVPNSNVIGICTGTIQTPSFGYVTAFGEVNNIDTWLDADGLALDEGDIVYLSATVPGGFVKTPPPIEVPIGIITNRSMTEGKIAVSVSRPPPMAGIRDVVLEEPIEHFEGLIFDPVTSLWKNSTSVTLRAIQFKMRGDAIDPVLNDPDIELSYNIATVTNEAAVGVYRLTVIDGEEFGVPVLPQIIAVLTVNSQELQGGFAIQKAASITNVDPSPIPLWFEFTFYEGGIDGVGAGARAVLIPTDMTTLDVVNLLGTYASDHI